MDLVSEDEESAGASTGVNAQGHGFLRWRRGAVCPPMGSVADIPLPHVQPQVCYLFFLIAVVLYFFAS